MFTRLLVLPFLILSVTATAQAPAPSKDPYYGKVLEVYTAYRMMKLMEEVCSVEFPSTTESNRRAYDAWRGRYQSFVVEMEKHWTTVIVKQAGEDPQAQAVVRSKSERIWDALREKLRRDMASDGRDAFQQSCVEYPRTLAAQRANLEEFYKVQLATIRRGPA
jgi:glucuronate isomerase